MATPKQLRDAATLQAKLNAIDTRTDVRIAKLRERFDAAMSAIIDAGEDKRAGALAASDSEVRALLGINTEAPLDVDVSDVEVGE